MYSSLNNYFKKTIERKKDILHALFYLIPFKENSLSDLIINLKKRRRILHYHVLNGRTAQIKLDKRRIERYGFNTFTYLIVTRIRDRLLFSQVSVCKNKWLVRGYSAKTTQITLDVCEGEEIITETKINSTIDEDGWITYLYFKGKPITDEELSKMKVRCFALDEVNK